MSRTIRQTRDARSPLLPPSASQTILEVEQENRDPGLRTTGLTIEEIESAGVGKVEISENYETFSYDNLIVATVSNISVTIGSDMAVGATKTIVRLAAYDGDPVTVIPPPGTTIQGDAIVMIYNAYDVVRITRVSDTIFTYYTTIEKIETLTETAVSYETSADDSTVTVSASDTTISIGSLMRVGSKISIYRTAAYDGNPVTITPPSGATFEGRASIALYGQYSFVELERISSTVFVIKILEDAHTSNRSLNGGVTKVVEIYKHPKIRQISGVIRYYNDVDGSGNPGWDFINDHYALGLGLQVGATSSTVNLTWTISDFVDPRVVSFVCTPDEGYAKMGLFCGASVARNSASISLYAGELGDYITYNSDTGLWESLYGNITAVWSGSLLKVVISPVKTGGAKFIYKNYPFPTIGNRCGTVGSVQVEGQHNEGEVYTHELSFWNHAGTQITSPQAGMRFWIKTGIPKALNPLTDFSEGNSNLWFNGYIIDADSVGG